MNNDTIIESCLTVYSKEGKEKNRECTIALYADDHVSIFYKKDQFFGRAVAQGIGGIFAREVYSAVTDHGMTYLENFYVSAIDNIKRSPNPHFENGWRFYLIDGNSFDITMEPDFLNALSKAISKIRENQPKNKEKVHKKTVENVNNTTLNEPIFDVSQLPAPLRRAFIFIEDGEWEKADSYLERILDTEPENSYAYLGKLMIAKQIHHPSELRDIFDELQGNKNFNRAYTYADEQLKEYLIWIIRSNDLNNTTSTKENKTQNTNTSFTGENTSASTKTDSHNYNYSDYYEYAEYGAAKYSEPKKTQGSTQKQNTSKHLNKTPPKKKKRLLFPMVLIFVTLLIACYFGKLQIGYVLLDHGNTEIASKLILLDNLSGTKFLKGNWIATSGEKFSIDADGHLIDGLPCIFNGNYMWEIRNSVIRVYTETDHTRKNDKTLKIISRDVITVHCYANQYTYTLKRQYDGNLQINSSDYTADSNDLKIYTITLNRPGALGGTNQVRVEYGKLLPESALAPKRDGFYFLGYFALPSKYSEQYYDSNMKPLKPWMHNNDGELYAIWEKEDTGESDKNDYYVFDEISMFINIPKTWRFNSKESKSKLDNKNVLTDDNNYYVYWNENNSNNGFLIVTYDNEIKDYTQLNENELKAFHNGFAAQYNVTISDDQIYISPNNIVFYKFIMSGNDSGNALVYITYYNNKEILLIYDIKIDDNNIGENILVKNIIDSIYFQ